MNPYANTARGAQPDDAAAMPQLPQRFIMAFWHNWASGGGDGYQRGTSADIPLTDIPEDYAVVAVAFMKGAGIPTFQPYNLSDDAFRAQVAELNRQGRAVLISLGGADAHIELHAGQEDALAGEIVRLVERYGFDGLDIDLEQSAITAADNQTVIPAALKMVKDHYAAQGRHFIVSMAPEFPYLKPDGHYAAYIAALEGYYDFIAPQYYNQGGDGVWVDELNMWLSQDNEERKEDFLYYLTDSLIHGTRGYLRIPADKLAIGLPANVDAAATGFVRDPSAVYNAFRRLEEAGNPIRGLMTWSANWDAGRDAAGQSYDWGFIRDYAGLAEGGDGGERPPAPTALRAGEIGEDFVALAWDAPVGGDFPIVQYRVYRDGQQVGLTTVDAFRDVGLRPGNDYLYQVTALDDAGRESAPSNSVRARTEGGGEPDFPEWQNGIQYQVGEGVSYLGKRYRCLQAHVSNPGWTPDAAITLWQLV
ncbi:chitinase [Chromobacterium phragmitis]|uniref:chitinase n=1 Tax=Chromobacterium phragmitis TaxID=2202141 RepID=A0A344ULB3_9NEIS|nr:glycosyl hydrolase family 18 protein [Chromobacterium phragmitis]AXE30690.1 chitinase [Chromobacterium phragmitis]AXE36061.1 chitinase [Chromobacterium phragmitis]